MINGGGAGIRTLGGVTPTTVFETVPFGRSGTPPEVIGCSKYTHDRRTFNLLLLAGTSLLYISLDYSIFTVTVEYNSQLH